MIVSRINSPTPDTMEEKPTPSGSRSDKWKAYTGMAASFLAMDQQAEAQVIYTDVDPDAVILNDFYAIDFDNDGTDDITLVHAESNFTTSSGTINVRAGLADGDIIGSASSSYVYASALAAGAPIAPGNPEWNVTTAGLMALRLVYSASTGAYGEFLGQTAYLGCRFVSGLGATHYAWVHITVDPQVADMTILGYAFESTPNTAIQAGDQGSTISILERGGPSKLQVFPNPVRDRATLRLPEGLEGQVTVEVLDGIGQVMQRSEFNASTGMRTSELDLASLPAGTYFMSVRNGDRVMHRKVTKVN